MRYVIAFLASCALIEPVYSQSPSTATDSRLNGTWIVESTEMDGEQVDGFNGSRIRIDGKSLRWTIKLRTLERVLTVDRSVTPNRFDQTVVKPGAPNKSVLGIYRFDRDRLVLCRADAGCPRPEEFVTKPDDCSLTLILRRESVRSPTPELKDGG
ncbi:TIGR03067 domain-containing protein [Rhodopirellula bahusiensis]|uniref:TIGR03067 domain-containing protein n=1 Tax=Rhodopirellula bahusiensis TaxID=2014065 RepID=A0A2G1VY85_9BACT|nr:TIGR03067 domain-containing protein [Rhodopirellula bahusiensis]PHQ31590.1 hypothetical protein CEE69_30390 [Rhodopirellula bahusiensis]